MSIISLVLGDFTFGDFEVPEEISFGGRQNLAVHELIGGGRVVNALGSEAKTISFSGVFSGADAAQRAGALDAVRAAGSVLSLGWDGFFYNVIIAQLGISYHKPWWLPFQIDVVVVNDNASQILNNIVPVAALVANDIGFAASLASQAGLPVLEFSLDALATGQLAVASNLGFLGNEVSASGDAVSEAVDSNSGSASVTQLVQTSGALAACGVMNGYIGRAMRNVNAGSV